MRAECECMSRGGARREVCAMCDCAWSGGPRSRTALVPALPLRSALCECALSESEWSLVPRVAVTIKRKKAEAVTRPCYTVQCSNVTFGI